MADYTHGVYGEVKDSVIANVGGAATATVAVGTLPVHLAADWSGLVGTPLEVEDATAKAAYGYSDDWDKFTLCEAVQAFVGGTSGNVGPLYCVNALDPSVHKETAATTATVAFDGGVGYVEDGLCIVSTVAVKVEDDDKECSAAWNPATGKVEVRAAGVTGNATVSYTRVKPGAVSAADIAKAVGAADDLYPLAGVVPDILIAPRWSDKPEVYAALVAKAQSVDGHFLAMALVDIPTSAADVEAAIAWKAAQKYDSKFSKACWPCASDADGRVYRLSTLFAREMVRRDTANAGVPYATASNTPVDEAGVCLSNGTAVKLYNEQGNQLNAYGISTAIAWGGQVRLWGGHTAAYRSGADNEALGIFDTNIRMLAYVANTFQLNWVDYIDQPLTLALRDTILFSEQSRLDGLVATGALVGNPRVQFLASSNTAGDIVEGDFTFDMSATPTPQFKTARAVVAYTTEGFSAYIDQEEGE